MLGCTLGVLALIAFAQASPARASGVGSPTVELSSTAAGVSGTTYDVEFTTSEAGGLASGDTLTVALPPGTVIPNRSVSLSDETTGQSLNGTSSPTLTDGNATATWTVFSSVPAGHKIQVTIPGVTNAGAGSGSAQVSTSADSTPVASPSFTLTAPQSLSSASAALSTTVQSAPGVSYTVDFNISSTGQLQPGQGTITLALPAGTVIPNRGVSLTDVTTGQQLSGASGPVFANGNATATWTVNGVVPAGHRIELGIDGVTNANTGGIATVSTSSDGPANTPAFTLTPVQSLSAPAVALSTPVQGVSGVTYALDFTTSSTGALQPGEGKITVALPAGTVIPNQGVSMSDLTTGQSLNGASGPVFANGAATATWTVNGEVPAGHRIELLITNVSNAASGASASISTSSDTPPVSTSPFTLSATQSVTSPSVALSTTTQGVKGVTYTLDFTTSSTGALQPGHGTITVALPTGTVIPNSSIAVADLTTGQQLSGATNTTLGNGGATATWTVNGEVPAGHRIELEIVGVTNANTGGTASVSTSSDTPPVSTSPITLTTKQSASSAVVELSNQTASATNVSYTVDFTTSATGSLQPGQGTITIAMPAGTVIPANAVSGLDLSSGRGFVTGTPTLTNGSSTATYTVGAPIAGGDRIQLVLTGVQNPAAGSYTISTSTSSDNATSTPAYQIGPGATPPAFGPSVLLSSPAAGAKNVTYQVTFFNTAALATSTGTITLTAPTGTVFPNQGLQLFDLTTGQSLGTTFSPNSTGNSLTWTVAQNVPANHEIRVTLPRVTNPAAAVSQITVATSGQGTVGQGSYQIVNAAALTAGGVMLSTPAINAHGVTYSTEFTTSSTGALAGSGGTITLTAPVGTVLPNQGLHLFDVTAGQDLGTTFSPGATGNTLTYGVVNTVPANHRIRATVFGVNNPGSASTANSIQVATSSDNPDTTSNYATAAANSLTAGGVTISTPATGVPDAVYTFDFTTSATGVLVDGQGTITVTAPPGTVLPNQGLHLVDMTTGQDLGTTFSPGGTGNALTYGVTNTVPAGHRIHATVNNVTNPAAAATTNQIQVSTSSDTSSTTSNYTTAAPGALAAGGVTLSTPAIGAHGVTYSMEFTTSSTGLLANGQGTISLSSPAGTVFPNQGVHLVDLTSGQDLGTTFSPGSMSNTPTYVVTQTVPAGHRIRATATNVVNPTTPSTANTIQISTGSDNADTTSAYTTAQTNALTAGNVTLSTPTPGATGVVYGVEFRTSSTGALIAGLGTITLTAPTGTVFPSNQGLLLFDVTSGQILGTTFAPLGNGGNSLTWTITSSVPAGHKIRATVSNATNPPAASNNNQITVSTSSDSAGTTSSYTTGAATAPSVSRVSPTTGPTAGGTAVTITGANFTGATGVKFGATAATSFSVTDSSHITATSPAGNAGTVDVTVTTPSGTSATSAADNFTYFAQPTVTNVNPSSGPTSGGTLVTITGTNFTGATSVEFGANAAAFTVDSATKITATAPAGSAGTFHITVTTPGGTSPTGNPDRYTYVAVPVPTVTGVSPASGPTAGGTTVTITGTNLDNASAVRFGGLQAVVTSNTSDQIIARSPASGAGTVHVTVTTPGGTSAAGPADQFTYVAPVVQPPPKSPPSVAPSPPASSGPTAAAVSGTVNPQGQATTVVFQYGLDLSQRGPGASTVLYDQSTAPQQLSADTSNHTVQANLTNLIPGASYHVRMVATNATGTTNGPDQAFTTPKAQAPPPPVLGQTQNAAPVSGKTFVLINGKFVPLTGSTKIPSGATIDALRGSLTLTSATGVGKKTQTGTFGGAVFKVTQTKSGPQKGLTTLTLVNNAFKGAPSLSSCTSKRSRRAKTASLAKAIQLLHAKDNHGHFRTRGRRAAATTRGTVWSMAERCDGTLTQVSSGSVVVNDFARRINVIVRAGHSYLAKAPK